MGKRFASFYRCLAFGRFWKVKFWRSFTKCQYFNDGWTDFHKNIYLYIFIWGFFQKPGKPGSHTGSKWWPGDPVTRTWKMTQMTHWPGDPMTLFRVCGTASRSEVDWLVEVKMTSAVAAALSGRSRPGALVSGIDDVCATVTPLLYPVHHHHHRQHPHLHHKSMYWVFIEQHVTNVHANHDFKAVAQQW